MLIINLARKKRSSDGIIASFAKLRILALDKNERNGNEDEDGRRGEGTIALVRSCNCVAAK